jgi:hypothetical protein
MNRGRTSKLVLLALVVLGVAACIWWQFYPRDVRRWESSLATADGEMLKALFTYSNTKQFGHAHLVLVGGDSPEFKVRLTRSTSAPIDWRGDIRPVAINILKGRLYLVSLGRRNNGPQNEFVCEAYDGGHWREIPLIDVPPVIAINNCGFPDGNTVSMSAVAHREYLKTVDFRRSITARLWFCMEYGKSYSDVYNATIPEEFVLGFYSKHFGGPIRGQAL